MEKIIEIDLLDSENFFEQYNRKKVSRNLIDYLISEGDNIKFDDTVKIIINDSMGENIDCIKLIKEGLKQEYDMNYRRHQRICLKQVIYLLFGILFLFLSTRINLDIFKEVIVILGWVLIWSMFELEIFSDVDSKKRRKTLKKILDSEFIENDLK